MIIIFSLPISNRKLRRVVSAPFIKNEVKLFLFASRRIYLLLSLLVLFHHVVWGDEMGKSNIGKALKYSSLNGNNVLVDLDDEGLLNYTMKSRSNLDCSLVRSIDEVKIANTSSYDRVLFDQFYQHIPGKDHLAWNVSMIDVLMFTKYFSTGFIIERADFTSMKDKLWTTDMAHRFGLKFGQSYLNNDSIYFEARFAKVGYFPCALFKGRYYWDINQTKKAYGEMLSIILRKQECYAAAAFGVIRSFKSHQLTIVPYWSIAVKSRLNLALKDKIYMQQHRGYLALEANSGYLLDDASFIDYDMIRHRRWRFSCDSQVFIPGIQAMLCPACGVDYCKEPNGSFHPNWFVKLGLMIHL